MPLSARVARHAPASLITAAAVAAIGAASAGAIVRSPVDSRADRAQRTSFDVRTRTRALLDRRGVESVRRPSADTRSARARLRGRLGHEALLDVDALTGTPRTFARLDGVLAGPAQGSARDVAWRFARSRATELGLADADFGSFGASSVRTSPSGITTVRWRQLVDGIPLYDNGLRVNLGRGNRVLSVQGAPVHDPVAGSTVPQLSAEAALRALMENVGEPRSVAVTSRSSDVRRTTRFSTGDRARLVMFRAGGGTRLAWSVTYRSADAWYEGVVDATGGRVLRRTNLTRHAIPVRVVENFPGAPVGGTQQVRNLDVPAGSTTLSGPSARTYLDVDDDDQADAGEEVVPGQYVFQSFATAGGFCTPTALCSWNPAVPDSWQDNAEAAAVQAHYFVSRFHDHLERPAGAGFGDAEGNFELNDPVEVNVDDGADTAGDGGPDAGHVDNANMSTPPEGQAPLMQMFLFRPLGGAPFRAVNGSDSSDVVYHEYTHGLSNRLVVNEEGFGAVSSPQSGAMGEGWSDWYAKDFIVRQGLQSDTAAEGEIFLGVYTDGVQPGLIRTEALDCSVGGACSGTPGAGSGGYTYGDFGRLFDGPEVHDDGEIWAQTLWDLRRALVARTGSQAAGSDLAEQLVTDGMRLSPVEPSMLDMRNAILGADQGANGGANRDLIWGAFAGRGMGYFAGALDGNDTAPAQDFAPPPAAGGPTGTIAGSVTDDTTGLPVAGLRVGVGGHSTGPGLGDFLAADTAADGSYSIAGVPVGTYPKLAFLPSQGYDAQVKSPVTVAAGQTSVQDAALRRDWAASSGGAAITSNDDTGAPFGCGHDGLVDQGLGTGWSPFQADAPADEGNEHVGSPPAATIELPRAIDITSFGMDPSHTCGDDETAATKDFRLETSTDGVSWSVAKVGSFTPADSGRLNSVAPDANATGVRFVRLALLAPRREQVGDSGELFIDFSELEVFGGPPNSPPSGTLGASPASAAPNQAVTLSAAFTDPDSRITGYDWDLDGNGTIDRSTAEPQTSSAYAAPGSYAARVVAKDFRGGSGTASTTVQVTQAPRRGANPLRPRVLLPASGRRGRVAFRVSCDSRCAGRARLTVRRRTARRLRLGRRRNVGAARVLLAREGQKRITIRLSRRTLRAMRRARVRRLQAVLSVAVTDAERQRRGARRTIRIRR